jgi:hypothetical protein
MPDLPKPIFLMLPGLINVKNRKNTKRYKMILLDDEALRT